MALTVAFAVRIGMIDTLGVAALALFAIVCHYYRVTSRPYVTKLPAAVLIVLAALLATPKLPGFHGLPLLAPLSLRDGSRRFWLLGHLDKPAVGSTIHGLRHIKNFLTTKHAVFVTQLNSCNPTVATRG